ncbi:cytochrome c heme lyase [Mycena crocata]|nr:cytochrome c heme lyase [Mycena crocata]
MGQTSSQSVPPPGCPIDHKSPSAASASTSASGCPIPHDSAPKPKTDSGLAQCPIDHGPESINSRNQMPNLSQEASSAQAIVLPTSRTESSIPRDGATKWEYPSPQQFYNALARKGHETPEELAHAETMVEIHNFLNEQAWQEVVKWEKRAHTADDIQLARFKGRPGEMSPKARIWMLAGWIMPSKFNTEPPFDRHDWVVRRPKTGEEVRYVIDYYSAPPEPDGSPVFSLDVRPALDSFGSLKERIAAATEDVWAGLRENSGKTGDGARPQSH